MAEDTFDRLLVALPKIAEAVNQFESREVQEQAFEALVRALGLTEPTVAAPRIPGAPGLDFANSENEDLNGDGGEVDETETTTTTTRRRRRRPPPPPPPPPRATVSVERDIDFRPQGKQSFRDFATEKGPKANDERNVVAVYYLEQILSLESVGAGHVLAAYRDAKWREPGQIANSLAKTASTKGWLDTRSMAAIRTTASGRNQVEHDMPAKT